MDLSLSDFQEKKDYSKDDPDRVLALLLSKGSCFPTEITRHLALTIHQVNSILTELLNEDLIKHLVPDRNYPQAVIGCRIEELGARGYDWFAARSWYSVSLKGFYWYLERHRGEHKRASSAYLLEYTELAQKFK